MRLMQFQIDDIIKTALLEDINYIDVTTDYLVDENSVSTAKYVSKDEGVLCGIDVAMRVFQLLDSNVKCEIFIHDGEKVKKGDIIARITGSTRALLKVLIPTTVNILQSHLISYKLINLQKIKIFLSICIDRTLNICYH